MRARIAWVLPLLVLAGSAPAASLYAIDNLGIIVRVDPDTGALLDSLFAFPPLAPLEGSLAFDGTLLYAFRDTGSQFGDGTVYRIDAGTGLEVGSFPSPFQINSLAFAVTGFGPTLLPSPEMRWDPVTGATLGTVSIAYPPDPFVASSHDVSPATGTLFVAGLTLDPMTFTFVGLLWEFDTDTGAFLGARPLPVLPAAMTFVGERLFLTNSDTADLIEVEAETGLLVDAIPGQAAGLQAGTPALAGSGELAGPPALALKELAPGWRARVLTTLDFETRVLAVDAAGDLYVADAAQTADGTVEILKLDAPDYDTAGAQAFLSYAAEAGYCCVNGLAFAPGEQVVYASVRSLDGESGIVDRVTFPGPVVTRYADLAESPGGDPFRATGIGVSGDDTVFVTARRGLETDFGAIYSLSGPAPAALTPLAPPLVGRGIGADATGNRYVAVKDGTGFTARSLYRIAPGGSPRQRIARFDGLQPDEIAVGEDGTVYAALHRAGQTLVVALTEQPLQVPAATAWTLGLLAAALAAAARVAPRWPGVR